MSSSPTPQAADSFLNSPLITTITGYIVHLQERNFFSKEHLLSLKTHFLITIGFLVLLYCLIHIQILFFWLLKLIFRIIFKFFSFVFWLPLKTVRIFIPKSIDYDILFPLFWLCSISSFYLSKFSHENVWQFYDQYLVQRYKIFTYNQEKREEIKRYIFILTFIVLLLFQSLFILLPIALSIRHNHQHPIDKTPIVSTPVPPTKTVTTPTAKSAVKDVMETMSGNLYNRFIEAFKDENETQIDEKRPSLVSDEKIEDTLKTLKRSVTKEIKKLQPKNEQKEKEEEKKSSRFQRWIVYYLKAPFRKYETKSNKQINNQVEQKSLQSEPEEEEEKNNTRLSSSSDTDDDQEEQTTVTEQIKQRLQTVQDLGKDIRNKISSSKDEDDEDSDDDDEEEDLVAKSPSSNASDDEESDDDEDDSDEEEEESTIDKVKEQLAKPIEKVQNVAGQVRDQIQNKLSSSTDQDDDDSDEEESIVDQMKEKLSKPIEKVQNVAGQVRDQIRNKLSSSTDQDDDDSDEEESTTDKIKEQIAKPVEQVQTIAEAVGNQLRNKFSSSTQRDDEESGYESDEEEEEDEEKESSELAQKIKRTLSEPLEKVKNATLDIKNKLTSSTNQEDEESDEESTPITEQIKERLAKPIETAKDLGEKIVTNIKSKIPSSLVTEEEDLKIESDEEEEEEEEEQSVLDRVKQNVIKPVEKAATNLRDKLPSLSKSDDEEEDSSLVGRAKQTAEKVITPIKEKISSNTDQLKHRAVDLVDSAEGLASDILGKSAEYLHEKTEQIKGSLPKTDQIKSKIQRQIVEPLEDKAAEVQKALKSKGERLKTTVIKKIKSLKKQKKSKSLTEKAKDKFRSLSKSVRDKLPGHDKKKKKAEKKLRLLNKIKPNFPLQNKLNGWIDDAWNIWHLATVKIAHLFTRSSKHARLLPRYNTTSLYTAYTDLHCYDYTKKINRYRLLKRKYLHFLDTYRHHSPFPVYLSILKSNGPRCYRRYPDSSCGVIPKSSHRNFKAQLYRFVRFWAIIGVLVILLAMIYKNITTRKQKNVSSFRSREEFDRSSPDKQTTTVGNRTDPSHSTTTTTTQRPTSINQQTISTNNNTSPLDEQIGNQLRQWLEHEQNDGFRNLSETCRIAINNTFLKELERLSVETLQFANAKMHNVSQNNHQNNKTSETPAEKIMINARLEIDHLILNIVQTFKEKHFSLETQRLSGQLLVALSIHPNQYSIEANLQQLQINPFNIIDPNNALSTDEKQSIIKLIDETIKRTIVRCSFRLSDNQENNNPNVLHNSSAPSYLDTTKTYSSSNQLSTSSIQTNASHSRQTTPNRYQPSEPLPTVLINDTHQQSYTDDLSPQIEPRRLLVRIVKAVKLHDVEQPYCILELNHPKQIQQTSIANNGLNPFWDERFLFECDDKSNQIHLQIIDRKITNKRMRDNYVDTVYADVSIPFSYVTSTVYKQDVQISPRYPESIIRIEFSTLSEEEALAANNGYDVESLTDSQTWTYNEREAQKLEQDYPQRYVQSPSNDFLSTSYDNGTLPKHYGLSSSLYDDERDYSSTLPRSIGLHSNTISFPTSTPLSSRDGGLSGNDKPHKSKSFMSSLKHLTLPRRKHRHKDKHDHSMDSQASSISQLNNNLQSPQTNPVSHSLSSALPGPNPNEHFLGSPPDSRPIRRTRSISQSFKNLFRSSSKKKANAAKADALGEFENVDNRDYLTASMPTTKKLSFLQRRKSKQKAKQQTNFSTNSLSSYDCSRIESVRDTPIRANVGHPVTMTKQLV